MRTGVIAWSTVITTAFGTNLLAQQPMPPLSPTTDACRAYEVQFIEYVNRIRAEADSCSQSLRLQDYTSPSTRVPVSCSRTGARTPSRCGEAVGRSSCAQLTMEALTDDCYARIPESTAERYDELVEALSVVGTQSTLRRLQRRVLSMNMDVLPLYNQRTLGELDKLMVAFGDPSATDGRQLFGPIMIYERWSQQLATLAPFQPATSEGMVGVAITPVYGDRISGQPVGRRPPRQLLDISTATLEVAREFGGLVADAERRTASRGSVEVVLRALDLYPGCVPCFFYIGAEFAARAPKSPLAEQLFWPLSVTRCG